MNLEVDNRHCQQYMYTCTYNYTVSQVKTTVLSTLWLHTGMQSVVHLNAYFAILDSHFASKLLTAFYFAQNFASKFGQGLANAQPPYSKPSSYATVGNIIILLPGTVYILIL